MGIEADTVLSLHGPAWQIPPAPLWAGLGWAGVRSSADRLCGWSCQREPPRGPRLPIKARE